MIFYRGVPHPETFYDKSTNGLSLEYLIDNKKQGGIGIRVLDNEKFKKLLDGFKIKEDFIKYIIII